MLTIAEWVKRARSRAGGLLRRTAPSTKPYEIGNHTILLTSDHLLPEYQSRHRLYDRFLPYLCAQFDDRNHWIIDVGANVGDTAVSIAQVCQNPLLCIEGDDEFFNLLEYNVDNLRAQRERAVICSKAIAGSGRFLGTLQRDGTTATLTQSQASCQRAATLDDLSREAGAPAGAIAIIKVDTDGYDGDVILSAANILEASRPVLYWENYFATIEQMRDLNEFYQTLHNSGYSYFWVFDNYGNLMLRECSIDNIMDLNDYVASQEFHGCTRSIFYTDVLAAPDDKLARVQEAISIFRLSVSQQKNEKEK